MDAHDRERKPRYPIVLFAGLAVAITAVGGYYARRQVEALERETQRKVSAISELEAAAIAHWREDQLRAADAAARAWGVLIARERAPGGGAGTLPAVVAALDRSGLFAASALLAPDGRPVAAAGDWAGGLPALDQPAARAALARGAPVMSELEDAAGAPVLHVFAPALDATGQLRGVAAFRVDARLELLAIVERWPTPSQTGESLLLRRDGDEVVFLSETRHRAGSARRLRADAADLARPSVLATRGAPGFARGPDYRGVRVLAGFHPVPGTTWAVVSKVDEEEVLRSLAEPGLLVLLAVAAMVAASGAAIHLYTRRERTRFLERAWSAERRARLLRDEQARLIEAVHDPVILIDVERRIRFWNQGAERLYGATAGEVVGRPVRDVLETRFRQGTTAENFAILEVAGALRTEARQRRPDGAEVEVEISAVSLKGDGGALTGFLAVIRDLSAQRRAHDERQLLQARLAETDRMASMGLLAASVAHELANPVAYVLTNARFARDELDRPAPDLGEARAALDEAVDGAERVRRILGDLRTFSRARDGGDGPAEVRPVVESAIRIAAAELRHRARVVTDVPALPPVAATAHRLGQVLLNLVVNAAQAIPAGSPEENEVRVAARRDGAEVVIEVSDTGAGIPPELQREIFEPFFTTKPAGVGTGLGLAICRRLVHEAGGAIDLESAPGRGTTFRVRLPLAQAAPVREVVRGRVLVVDDEPKVARTLARGLETEHEVHVETDPRHALERLRRGEDFDVVLCDVVMPGLGGLALFEEAGRLRAALAERFVFVTGGGAGRADPALVATGRTVVSKPFDVAEVRALVHGRVRAARAALAAPAGDGAAAGVAGAAASREG